MNPTIFKPKLLETCPLLLVFCLFLLRGVVLGQPISIAQPYDIIISEFMADPTPSRGLPEAEFIELYNRSNKYFNLKDYRIMNGKDTTLLKNDTLKPKQYKIIYKKASNINFGIYGDTIPVSKLGKLNNPQDLFYLVSSKDTIIDAASYDLTLYQDSKKATGGYTLERTNINSPCNPMGWKGSDKTNGGTPGKPNSVSPILSDSNLLEIDRYYMTGNDKVDIVFNKSLDRKIALDAIHYELIAPNSKITPLKIDSLLFQTVQIKFSPSLTQGNSYLLIVKKTLKTCLGTSNLSKSDTILMKVPEELKNKELIVNEILANPESGGSRFIELYNNSKKVFDIKNLRIGSDTTASDNLKISTPMTILPKEYVVFTENPIYIQNYYKATAFRKRIIKQKLPAWNEAGDNVTLSFENIVLDTFNYQKSWHNPLLANTEGVSLERVNPNKPSNDASNWQSAAQTVGFATPAQQNSQFDTSDIGSIKQVFALEKKTFSPDSDGFEDFLSLHYHFDKGGYSAYINIFNDKGKLVKKLKDNELLSVEGIIKWEGDTDEGLPIRPGIYVLAIEWISPIGQVKREKLACIVAGRL